MTGGGPSNFFGSEILAKSDFFGSMKDARIFLSHEEKQRDFLGLREIFGCTKKVLIFLGRQIL